MTYSNHTTPSGRPAILDNLVSGAKLALFQPVRREDFHFNADQAIFLVLLGIVAYMLFELVSVGPIRGLDVGGFIFMLITYAISIFSLYVVALVQRTPSAFVSLVVMLEAGTLVPLLVIILITWLTLDSIDDGASSSIGLLLLWLFVYLAWYVYVFFRSVGVVLETSGGRTALLFAILMAIQISAYLALPNRPIWYPEDNVGRLSSLAAEPTCSPCW